MIEKIRVEIGNRCREIPLIYSLKAAHSRVAEHVRLQLIAHRECLVAFGALVGLVVRVATVDR